MLTKTDLNAINKLIKTENQVLRKEMKKGFDKLNKKLDKAINFLDRDYINLLKRVERIEQHLKLEPISPF